jgi:hypothetical protein
MARRKTPMSEKQRAVKSSVAVTKTRRYRLP